MIDILFVVDNEVTRRALKPVLDLFIQSRFECRIVANLYCVSYMQQYAKYFINETDAKDLTCKFVISSNPLPENFSKGWRVSIPHGAMFGNTAWSLLKALHSEIYFGISPQELPYIKRHLNGKFDDEKFYASGCPHNDYLINIIGAQEEFKSQKRATLGLGDKKTMLLSSHWTSIGNLRRFGTGLLDALIWNFPNHQVICTCHPNLLTSPKGEFRVNREVRTPHFDAEWLIRSLRSRENEQVKLILDMEKSAELLLVSDIFIGDNSSMLIEAAMFKIPLIKSLGGHYFDESILKIVRSETYEFGNIEELLGAVTYLDDPSRAHMKTGREIRDLFAYNVGFAAQTIFDKLKSMN